MAKGPKTLNPADKARKEARKKELKKNKKQRQQVRTAVMESRDPEQVMADLEKLDQNEFDITTNPTMNDTIYKDKRKKLKEIWERILVYYQKEDQERYSKLKKLEHDYEARHKRLAKEFEAMKAAKEVKIEDIFLPPEPDATSTDAITDDDPLMSESIYITPLSVGFQPPGCPPGLPPDLEQLAIDIQSSLAAPTIIPQALPQDILNLPKSAQEFRNRAQRGGSRRRSDRERTNKQRDGDAEIPSNSDDASSCKVVAAKQATVIESKPVIFISKATKFVPASVRSKLNKTKPT